MNSNKNISDNIRSSIFFYSHQQCHLQSSEELRRHNKNRSPIFREHNLIRGERE